LTLVNCIGQGYAFSFLLLATLSPSSPLVVQKSLLFSQNGGGGGGGDGSGEKGGRGS
jgi:hypothetical protein